MQVLLDVEQLRASDAWAIEERGIAGLELMERAAEGLAEVVGAVSPRGRVVVVCGGGNNGGDGYAVARLLRGIGREVDVAWTGDPDKLKGDARANWERLDGEGVAAFGDGAVLRGAAVVVDAILGTGFSGTPREDVARAIEAINDGDAPVVACDVPSGVDASTGAVEGAAVRAVATATFHAAMPGLWIAPGKQHAGEVHVVDIGIPSGDDAYPVTPRAWLIDRDVLATYPRRGADSTKFASGHVVIAGGSRGLTGAPCLSSLAAMRAGAGYVTACVPESLNDIFEIKLTEVMSVPLPDDGGAGHHTEPGAGGVLEKTGSGSLVVGPGLGRTDGAFAFARRLTRNADVPIVLDADGLNAHTGARLDALSHRHAPTVLTPHAGELARLLDTDSETVGRHRLSHARQAAGRAGAIVVLKGDDTIVAEPEGRIAISRGNAPGLATAGTGDVLSGILGAFLARGMAPFEASAAAVFLHAEAGRAAARTLNGPDGVIAGDVVDALARVLE